MIDLKPEGGNYVIRTRDVYRIIVPHACYGLPPISNESGGAVDITTGPERISIVNGEYQTERTLIIKPIE